MTAYKDLSLTQWLDRLAAGGVYAFPIETLKKELGGYSSIAIKRALSRLSTKGKIVSLHKGYYLLLPSQYASKGILPPQLFIDQFMKYLERPYYLALLNAAALHGAAHQQPQEYFVMTTFPVLRPTLKRGLKMNYISVRNIPDLLLVKVKTESGYMQISNPALTASDLIQFEKRIGGLTRAVAVLNELTEAIQPSDFNHLLLNHVPVTALQRLGYLLENVCNNSILANALWEAMYREGLNMFRIPLKASNKTKGFIAENRWKVIVNTQLETDE